MKEQLVEVIVGLGLEKTKADARRALAQGAVTIAVGRKQVRVSEELLMAENVNPQAIGFANQKMRALSDAVLTAIQTARAFDADYGALSGDTLFPNNADLIADGSETDQRPRVQNQTVRALRTLAQDLVIWAASGSPTRETRLRTAAVNGQGKF